MKPGMSRLRLVAVAGAALALGACVGDDETLLNVNPPVNGVGTNGTSYFERYVSLGNSITAGYQSGGLVDSLQERSYAASLAARAGVNNFGIPRVSRPGCPIPFASPLTAAAGTTNCTLTALGSQPSLSRNLAVPGARLVDLLRSPSPATDVGRLNLLLLGPRSQVRAMKEAQPTFVSVWIGNNDALEAAVSGNLGPASATGDSVLTRLSVFQTQLNQLVDSIKAAGPKGVMLVGVVDAGRAAPILQPGAYFYAASQATQGRFQGKAVNANCSPVTATGAANPLSRNMVSFRIVADANFTEINCDPNAFPAGDPRRGVHLLDVAEQAVISERVGLLSNTTATAVPTTGFNALIKKAADDNGWVYVDPNIIFNTFLAETVAPPANTGTLRLYQRVRKCQLLATATLANLAEAVAKSCPNPAAVPATGTTNVGAPNFFGSLFSFDGVHPSTEAHRVLGGRFAAAINAKYGTTMNTAEN